MIQLAQLLTRRQLADALDVHPQKTTTTTTAPLARSPAAPNMARNGMTGTQMRDTESMLTPDEWQQWQKMERLQNELKARESLATFFSAPACAPPCRTNPPEVEMSRKTEVEQLTHQAGDAVGALEALALGSPWADVAGDADRAVAALRTNAVGELFPSTMEPASDAALRDFGMETAQLDRDVVTELLAVHAAAMAGGYGELAALIRSRRGRRFVVRAARQYAHPLTLRETNATAEARAELVALEGWEKALAGQLVGVADFEPSAEIIARVVPELRQRLDDARQQHEQHAAAELERLERERADAERVVDEQRAELQREADAEAAELERVAKRNKYKVELMRASALADRLEAQGKTVRLEERRLYGVAELAGLLRDGDISPKRVRQIEAILERAA